MEQSSILSAKFDRQNVTFLATVHECETGL